MTQSALAAAGVIPSTRNTLCEVFGRRPHAGFFSSIDFIINMTKQNRETREVQNPCIEAVGLRQDVLIWRQQVGLYRAYDNPKRVVSIGSPGMADAGMIVAVTITPEMVGKTIGVAVQPEFKTARGAQRANQESWERAVTRCSGVYRLVRTPEEMIRLVDDVQAGKVFTK